MGCLFDLLAIFVLEESGRVAGQGSGRPHADQKKVIAACPNQSISSLLGWYGIQGCCRG